ncbi:hypothetical protein CH54_4097 [Yersinia rochesterensis]|uniref:Uncharacterized protein n=1 Tax=Yersinia rochesterensis TaxID=1604335 RepID=A0ABM5SM60_9GAMM|nr:hypothetical protein DJ57_838 [Yersinia rochesterensis]AJI86046.1 hypothetical protein AW19_1689 [Yersinia frederiksenii Y225]AJJ35622.1 hypothetical protein CH54_4097 [Yersinia rochesterensis]CRY60878.1 Uncharacterised protein [Yersinia kristensenii]
MGKAFWQGYIVKINIQKQIKTVPLGAPFRISFISFHWKQ